MGHLVGKDVFRKLGRKIDGLGARAPWNEKLHAVLKELYSSEEADVVVKMPYGLSTFERIQRVTGYEKSGLRSLLDSLTAKGLVMDLYLNGDYYYTPSPVVIGIFEFTMMRLGPDADSKTWARLLHEYMDGDFHAANLGGGNRIPLMRALPWEEAVRPEEYVEILDYEKASSLIAGADRFAIGLCSCRHEKSHLGEKKCDVPIELCSQFDYAADMMIRHNLAREVTRSEMEENFARSRELGLVMAADNVRKNMTFVCHCCKCCCNVMSAINKYGYPNSLLTSGFIAGVDDEACTGCEKCSKACPIDAIAMVPVDHDGGKRKQYARVDTAACLGCGVCVLQCAGKACMLTKRAQRVISPETTFEKIILRSLERGTFQNQIFDDPGRIDQKFMRAFVGAFFRLPAVKKALLSDRMRSRFLNVVKDGAIRRGNEWMLDL
jgi:formate hydrogenlyase subunit 6/NADH:ubiquinone oxidoreductase subunit I